VCKFKVAPLHHLHFAARCQPTRFAILICKSERLRCTREWRWRLFVFQFAELKFIYLCTFDLTPSLPLNGMRAHIYIYLYLSENMSRCMQHILYLAACLFSRHMTEFTPTRDTIRADEIDQYWVGRALLENTLFVCEQPKGL
jgi:hypothetical protein